MKQIKPKVIGYKQLVSLGSLLNSSIILSKADMRWEAAVEFEHQFPEVKWPIKSKFRPVYEK